MARRILMIDDDRRTLEIVRYFLGEIGCEVETYWNPREGLDAAKAERFDLILLDLVIPGMDGYSVAQELKNDPRTAEIPILFVSSKVQIVELFLKNFAGRADFLAKPFKRQELTERVERLLRPPDAEAVPARTRPAQR